MNTKIIDALRRAGISVSEYAKTAEALADAARKAPMPDMREIARLRLGMLAEEHGLLCVLTISFWRWGLELVRPNG